MGKKIGCGNFGELRLGKVLSCHQHSEHHDNQIGASMTWPWFEGDLKTLDDMPWVDHVHKGQLFPLDQLLEVPETEEEKHPAGKHGAKAD